MKNLITAFLFLVGTAAFAHEGAHGPEQKVAPHGGVLREGPTLTFELVKGSSDIKIYPLEHDGKPLDPKSVLVDTKKTSLKDARKKPVDFKLMPNEGAFILSFKKGTSHRYSLELFAQFEGKENKAVWQIELGSE